MSVLLATSILFTLMLVLLAFGLPIVFALGGSAVALGLMTMGTRSFLLIVTALLDSMRNIVLLAIPLFIFMGNILSVSKIAEDAYAMAYKWLGGLKGGLATGTVFICTLFAACTGVSGAATVTMGLIALPSMLKRGYDRKIAMGCIMGGGALGVLIPPSVIMILYGLLAPESVGRLFAGGVLPGLMLSGLFIIYITIRCLINPKLGPALPVAERASTPEKLKALKGVLLPIVLIILVLGSIFSGWATPTEASAVGCIGAMACALIKRSLNLASLREAVLQTMSLTALVMWIVAGATAFTTIFTISGASELIKGGLLGMSMPPVVIILVMQLIFFMLGCFMDPSGIVLLCTPIFVPVVRELGFSAVWFGVLFVVNMEMAYLTPPYGFNLFYMRGITPKDISMVDIYLAALPFIAIQAVALLLVLFVPDIITFLPNLLFGAE